MKTNFWRASAIAATLFLALATSACAKAQTPFSADLLAQSAEVSGIEITDAEMQAIENAAGIQGVVCRNIYPAPQSDIDCVKTMAQAIEKKHPDAAQKARVYRFMEIPDGVNDPLSIEVHLLNARILGACRGGEFAKCMETVYRTLTSAFDPHSGYLNAEEFAEMQQSSTGSFSGIGVEVGGKRSEKDPLTVLNPMEGSPGEKAGLLPGDLIFGISKDGTESGMRPIESYANTNEAVKDIRGTKGTRVRLLIERSGETARRVIVITRGTIDTQVVKATLLSEGSKRYGLIHIRQFDGQACTKTEQAYKKLAAGGALDGLVVSVERNPGGYMHEVQCVLDLFLDAKSFVLFRDRLSIRPYQSCRTDPLGKTSCQGDTKAHPGDITNGLPILVMTDGRSASASEIFAAAMKHNGRGVLAGTPTFGKGSAQTIIPFLDGSALKLTESEYLIGLKKDWIPVQCLGVTPDIPFDRGANPLDKDGKRITDCGLEHSIRSGGPMPNAPVHRPIKEANPALFAAGEAMLEAYKKHAAKDDVKLKKQDELLKRFEKEEKK